MASGVAVITKRHDAVADRRREDSDDEGRLPGDHPQRPAVIGPLGGGQPRDLDELEQPPRTTTASAAIAR